MSDKLKILAILDYVFEYIVGIPASCYECVWVNNILRVNKMNNMSLFDVVFVSKFIKKS